jgi:hypothetical protein
MDGSVEPVAMRITRRNRRGAGFAADGHQQEPDWATSDDANARARPDPSDIGGVERNSQWLDHGALAWPKVVRDRDEAGRRPGDELAQGAIDRSVPGEPDVQAEVGEFGPAWLARAAGHRRVHGDATSALVARFDDASELVPEDERPVQDRVTDSALGQPVAIRAAQPDLGDPHEDFPATRLRDGFIVEPKQAVGMESQGEHAGYCGASLASSGWSGIQTRIALTVRFAQA